MIKSLKRRFIAIFMTLFISIMATVMIGVFVIMSYSERNNSLSIIDNIISNNTLSKTYAFGSDYTQSGDNSIDSKIQRNAMIVRFTKFGIPLTFEYVYNGSIDKNELYKISEEIASFYQPVGKVFFAGAVYRYEKCYINGVSTLVLLDVTAEKETIGRLMRSSLIVCTLSIIAMFIISIVLAKLTVSPVDKAWKKQKEFIADASHELKTPLTVIDANIDVVMDNPTETVESQERWLGNIKEEASQMSKLVADLLYIAKSDSERDDFITSRFNISEVLTNTTLSFEGLAFEKGKNFYTNISENIFYNGDERKIKQLFGVLLDNALKYSAKNVYVQLKQESHKIILVVSNDGDTVSDDDKERIFERFYRGDKSRARTSGGTGLGLSIAKAIVERHKGTIYTDTNLNNLTNFVVIL